MIKPIKILVLVAVLVGGGIIVGTQGDVVQPNQLNKLEFQNSDITLQNIKDSATIVTSTDALGRVYKSDVVIPFTYLFPVASSTISAYIVEEQFHNIIVSLSGYRNCLKGMYGTSTAEFCKPNYLGKTIRNEIQTFRDSLRGRLEELKNQEFEFNITTEDIEDLI